MTCTIENLKSIISNPACDLGDNAWVLLDLVKSMKNSRFLDLGVRLGPSSAIMSFGSDENNNQICGCDVSFNDFFSFRGCSKYVNENYICYLADSVTLGKNWDEESFDLIFVDTIHTWDQVLCELYFWSNHINKNGYFVFHDSHWPEGMCESYLGKKHKRVDQAIVDFFGLDILQDFEDDNIKVSCYPESMGMTFVQIKNLSHLKEMKKKINWDEVFEIRNKLNSFYFNPKDPRYSGFLSNPEEIENEVNIIPN